VSKNRIDIGATRAIASFNMGNLKFLSLRKIIGNHPLFKTGVKAASVKDLIQLARSAKQANTTAKRYKKKKTERAAATRSQKSKKDVELYQAGQF